MSYLYPFYGSEMYEIYSTNCFGPEMYKENGYGPEINELYKEKLSGWNYE